MMPAAPAASLDIALERDHPELAALLGRVFAEFDHPSRVIGLPAGEIEAIVTAFGPKSLAEGLTVVARTPGGEMAGVFLAEDFATPGPEGLEEAAPNFGPIGALLDSLSGPYREAKGFAPGECAHLFMLGVDPTFAGQGIAHRLVVRSLENARALGYRCAVLEATGAASQHVFRKLGFRELGRIPYGDFHFMGERIFRAVPEPEAALLMELPL